MLIQLASDRRLTAIPRSDVDELADHLSNPYQISYDDNSALRTWEFVQGIGGDVEERFQAIQMHANDSGGMPDALERKFYEVVNDQPLHGVVTSQRWTEIVSGAAYAGAVMKHLEIPGPIVDEGCNAGYLTTWISKYLGRPAIGIDHSAEMIKLAERLGDDNQLVNDVKFVHGRFNRESLRNLEKVPGILSIKGGLELQKMSLLAARDALLDGGILVIAPPSGVYGPYRKERTFLKMLKDVGFGLLAADVIGGRISNSKSDPFDTSLILLLQKGADHVISSDTMAHAERAWDDGFRAFCNGGLEPHARQNLAYYRSTWLNESSG